MNIPFSFIPVGQFEYNVTAKIVEDEEKSRYGRAVFNYGLGRNITVGAGMEYLSSVTSGKTMPFVNASVKLGQYTLVSGEHSYGVRSKGLLIFKLPSRLQVDINYTRYNKGQKAIRVNYLDEKKIAVSKPFSGKKITAYSRLTLNQFRLPENEFTGKRPLAKYTSAEFLLSAVYAGISSNFTTAAVFTDLARPNIYSSLSLGFRFPYSIRFIPQAQYRYDLAKFSMVKAEVEKRLGKTGFINLSYEKNILNKISLVNLGLRLNFSFAQTSFSVSHGSRSTAAVQSARGSLIYDKETNYLAFTDQVNVGRGGLVIFPFLDFNCNGKRDPGEPKAFGLNIRINGGSIKRNAADTTIRVTGLEAYADYLVELDNSNFENVAWRLSKKTISVTVEPNHFKLIEVPVAVLGEASGFVKFDQANENAGLGRIIINFYNTDSILVGKTITEADGYFSFMKLAPGRYTAQVDTEQMNKLQMTASPALSFEILSNPDGDIKSGLQFLVQTLHNNQ